MTHEFTAMIQTFWIAHNPTELKSGTLKPGERISTGLDYLETHESALVQRQRLAALAHDYPRALAEWLQLERLRDPRARLADYRWQRETGGMTLPDGTVILTTREAQSQITSTVLSLSIGAATPPIRWKAESGWVSLGTEELGFVAAAVSLHVKLCFQAEEVVELQLRQDPSINVITAFDAAYSEMMATEGGVE